MAQWLLPRPEAPSSNLQPSPVLIQNIYVLLRKDENKEKEAEMAHC